MCVCVRERERGRREYKNISQIVGVVAFFLVLVFIKTFMGDVRTSCAR